MGEGKRAGNVKIRIKKEKFKRMDEHVGDKERTRKETKAAR